MLLLKRLCLQGDAFSSLLASHSSAPRATEAAIAAAAGGGSSGSGKLKAKSSVSKITRKLTSELQAAGSRASTQVTGGCVCAMGARHMSGILSWVFCGSDNG